MTEYTTIETNERERKRGFAVAFLSFFLLMSLAGQITSPGSGPYHAEEAHPLHTIQVDKEVIRQLSVAPDANGPLVFAVPYLVDLKPSSAGTLRQNANGTGSWSLTIHSPGARSLGVLFDPFRLPEGAELYLYTPDKKEVLGALTAANNKASGRLLCRPLPGDSLCIEYSGPVEDLNAFLGITQVNHDFRGILGGGDRKDEFYNASGPCNVDITCPEGADWQLEKRAVARIIINGNLLCTGSLIRQEAASQRAFMLTANHCIGSQSLAENSVFYFGYESPECGGEDGSISKTISGSTMLSTSLNIDFTLLELSEFPPAAYDPYLAGWDATGTIPDSTVTIHHPSADVKKISWDSDSPVIADFEDQGFDPEAFWQILQWDGGTTEGGSSGAPLFTPDQQIIGYLSGGYARCGNSVNDYYGRFDLAWDKYAHASQQLKAWLDPGNTGIQSLDGMDPYASNAEEIYPEETGILLYPNPATDEIRIQISPDFQAPAEMTILKVTGEVVYSKTIENKRLEERVSVQHLSPGLYIVVWKSDVKTFYAKFTHIQ